MAASPARRRILQVLEDGDWHPTDQVLEQAARAVPPGQAWRTIEADRTRRNAGPRERGNDETAIAAGQRLIARQALWALCGSGHKRRLVERHPDRIRIRLIPPPAANVATPTPQETHR